MIIKMCSLRLLHIATACYWNCVMLKSILCNMQPCCQGQTSKYRLELDVVEMRVLMQKSNSELAFTPPSLHGQQMFFFAAEVNTKSNNKSCST